MLLHAQGADTGSTIPPCLLLDNVVPQTFGITGLRVGRADLHEPVSYTADGKSILFRQGDSAIEIHAHGYQERLGPVRYSQRTEP